MKMFKTSGLVFLILAGASLTQHLAEDYWLSLEYILVYIPTFVLLFHVCFNSLKDESTR